MAITLTYAGIPRSNYVPKLMKNSLEKNILNLKG